MFKKYVVTLTEEEREQLRALVSTGKSATRKLNHARVLLLADRDGGVIDQKYIDATNDPAAIVGRRIVITADKVRGLIDAVRMLGETLARRLSVEVT
jgi:hypothetical protein